MTGPTKVPLPMLDMIPSGYYAVRPDTETPYMFVRIARPTFGRRKGQLVVQTQHSDQLIDRWVWYMDNPDPRTNVRNWSTQARFHGGQTIEDLILLIIVNHRGCGRAYAQEIGRCHFCGKRLTDERSRWYGFGPECEKSAEGEKDEIDDENDGTYEQLKARGVI